MEKRVTENQIVLNQQNHKLALIVEKKDIGNQIVQNHLNHKRVLTAEKKDIGNQNALIQPINQIKIDLIDQKDKKEGQKNVLIVNRRLIYLLFI